ncbi:MAG TPA: ion channel [Ignavibacteriaceae bacterium]
MFKQAQDPGLGEKYFRHTKRIINKDGSFNIKRTGGGLSSLNTFHYLINISWTKFLLIVFAGFVCVNLFFAVLYQLAGIENLSNASSSDALQSFLNTFFFSVQTFATVGYGGIHPTGILSNIISSFESMTGILSFALATGLLYGRFSKPSAKIIFSDNAIITPFKDGKALMFRVANSRENILMEMEATAMITYLDKSNNNFTRKYFPLKLEIKFINFFPLPWTIVHPIDDDSPLNGKTAKDFEELEAELLIMVKGFDDSFSQHVITRSSYKYDEIEWDVKFVRAYATDETGETIVDLGKISETEKVN